MDKNLQRVKSRILVTLTWLFRRAFSSVKSSSIVAAVFVFLFATVVAAGSLTPPAGPITGTMNRLSTIWGILASTSYDSSAIVADRNGSLMENLKYIQANIGGANLWASASPDIYAINSGNVGIGTMTPGAKLEIGTPGDINLASSGAGYRIGGVIVLTTEGTGNLYVGEGAGAPVYAGGNYNTAVGYDVLSSNVTGYDNSAFGRFAMYSNTDGFGNSAYGGSALYKNSTGTFNTAVGQAALFNNETGSYNTATGYRSLQNSTGSYNTAHGYSTLYANTTGQYNAAFGAYALELNQAGSYNTATGYQALTSINNGSYNAATGYAALFSNTSGQRNTAMGAVALYGNTSGTYNTATGWSALNSNTGGSFNSALGSGALRLNTTGSDNVAVGASAGYSFTGSGGTFIGRNAGYATTSGFANTAIGRDALLTNTTGNYNTVTGYQALYSADTSWNNVAYGYQALYSDSTGSRNSAVGAQALFLNTDGSDNTANGYKSLYSNTSGSYNSAHGIESLYTNTIGNSNTAHGAYALNKNTSGNQNTAIGVWALSNNTSGENNTAAGFSSLFANTTGQFNAAVGVNALSANQTGSLNAAFGYRALSSGTTGQQNSAFGASALRAATGSDNVAVGASAGYSFTGSNGVFIGRAAGYATTTGSSNTAVGSYALRTNTTGGYHTALGYQALYSNNTGAQNTAVGYQTLFTNSTGTNNVAAGYQALISNTTGNSNTAYGAMSLYYNTTGSANTAVGYDVMHINAPGSYNTATGTQALYQTAGSYNTANGYGALLFDVFGSYNAALGTKALYLNTNGSDNIAVGASAGYSALGSGNVFLGRSAGYQETGSNTLWIDNASTASSSAFIYGEFNNDFLKLGANVSVSGNFELTGVASGSIFRANGGSISSASFAFGPGFSDMGMLRSSTTLLLQNKDVTPDASGRSRLSLGEEFFNLNATRTENAAHSGGLQCYDETGSAMICRFDVVDAGGIGTTRFLSTLADFGTSVSVSGNFELSGTVSSHLIPTIHDTYDLGSSANRWRDIYVASGSLHIGTAGDEAVIDYNVSDDYLAFKPNGSATTLRLWDSGTASLSGTLGLTGLHVSDTDLAPMYSMFVDTGGISSIVLGDPSNGVNQKYFGLTYYSGYDSLIIGGYTDGLGGQSNSIEVTRSGSVSVGSFLEIAYDLEVGDSASVSGAVYFNGLTNVSPGQDYVCRDSVSGEITYGSSCVPSASRFKEHIEDLDHGLDWLSELRPVTFDWKHNDEPSLGFIAEEVEEVTPLLALYQDGEVFSVNYQIMTAVLAKAIQEQQAMIEALQAGMNAQTIPLLQQDDESVLDRIVALFADVLGIEFSKDRIKVEELCLDDVCVTKDELQQLLDNADIDIPEPPAPDPSATPTPSVNEEPPAGEEPPVGNDEGGMSNDEVSSENGSSGEPLPDEEVPAEETAPDPDSAPEPASEPALEPQP